ncbi:hypothetical protein FQN54_003582 [Arachnomyces sp. PD_36]|nr:hypothetical protein FQN54_003582 [Arachnomyces sp. PD_36]
MEQFPKVSEEDEQPPPPTTIPQVAGGEPSSSPNPPPPTTPPTPSHQRPRHRTTTTTTTLTKTPSTSTTSRLRSASLKKFLESNPPNGMCHATGEIASRVPTLNEIRTGGFSTEGWTEEGQMERRGSTVWEVQRRRVERVGSWNLRARAGTVGTMGNATLPPVTDTEGGGEGGREKEKEGEEVPASSSGKTEADVPGSPISVETAAEAGPATIVPDETGMYPNGYRFPRKHTWKESTIIGLKAFGRFTLTPFGFIVTIYGLNVVAWGAMIFFVLLNAAPAMCHPTCDADESPRQKWIEIDAQILNALFCVTGFGLIPWRFRDLYFLLRWRWFKSHDDLRKLAGVHRAWFRLPDSDKLPDFIGPPPVYEEGVIPGKNAPPPYSATELEQMESNPALPIPLSSIPAAPLTGARAKPTKLWYLDLVVWMYVWNTIFQIALSGCMWGMDRFTRPAWTTGVFISVGCVVAIVAGLVVFFQGRAVKSVEGIPVDEEVDGGDGGEGDVEKRGELVGGNGRTGTGETTMVTPGVKRTKTSDSQWFKR